MRSKGNNADAGVIGAVRNGMEENNVSLFYFK
jgi:hypothetical protein